MKRHHLTDPIHQQLIKDLKGYLEPLGYQPGTVKMLLTCTQEFLWKLGTGNRSLDDTVQSADILKHHEYLQQRPNYNQSGGLSEMMIHHHLYSLRVFFDWLQQTNQINHHPMSKLKFKRPKTNPREVLTALEIKALYEACINLKERAMLSLFYGCGLRRSEGIRLAVDDVKFKEGMLYVRSGKGGRSRAVPMSKGVQGDLESYLNQERFAQPGTTSYLTNTKGLAMSGDSMNRLLKPLLHRAEITKEISLHSLRHSIATHLLSGGLSVEYVRDFLGHKHIESTQVYTRVNQKQFRKWN